MVIQTRLHLYEVKICGSEINLTYMRYRYFHQSLVFVGVPIDFAAPCNASVLQ